MSSLHFRDVSWLQLSFLSITVVFLFYVARTVYRLCFHPLARFPGPKLAAIGRWYEAYYEVVRVGMFSNQIQKLHEQYGPIVRINHQEVHIDDPDFYDVLYNFNPQLDKKDCAIENLQQSPSFAVHKMRRHALDSFFSRSSVTKLEWLVRDRIARLCDRVREAKHASQPVNFSLLYRCLTADIISEYSFGEGWNLLDDLTEAEKFLVAFYEGFKTLFLIRESHFVNVVAMTLKNLPPWMLRADEGTRTMLKLFADIQARTRTALRGTYTRPSSSSSSSSSSKQHITIFEEYCHTDKLPPAEKTEDAVFQNAFSIAAAGMETTSYTLATAHYHLLANPACCRRLQTELRHAWPQTPVSGELNPPPSPPPPPPSWAALEKLPYLRAVLHESLRLSIGVMARLSRVNHHAPMQYKQWTIPPHMAVSMSQRDIHYNATLFPEPTKFDPERWLQQQQQQGDAGDGDASNESKQKPKMLEKYLVSFSRGARGCIGINLAYAELYLTLATVFRTFDTMELFDTTRKDVDPKHDFFIPSPELDSKGVRVMVR